MSNFTFENQGVNTYLVYELPEGSQVDSLAKGMLTNNNIRGIANTLFTQMNATQYIKFNISSKISVNQLFSGVVNSKRLVNVLLGMVDAMITLEDYMLDYKMLVLDLDHIYVNVATEEVTMIYLPILADGKESMDAGQFFHNIIFGGIQFDQNEKSNYVMLLINYLSNPAGFSLLGFRKVLVDIKNSAQKQGNTEAREENTGSKTNNIIVDKPLESPPAATFVPRVIPITVPTDVGADDRKELQGKTETTPASVPEEEKKKSLLSIFYHEKKEKPVKKIPETQSKTASAPGGFAIPGQKAASVSGNFAVPGQEGVITNPTADAAPVPQEKKLPGNISPAAPAEHNGKNIVKTPAVYSGDRDRDLTVYDDFNDDEGTVVMDDRSDTPKISPYLLRVKTNEKIFINKAVFRMGRNSNFNDYNIQENKHIGHSHCHIMVNDGEYYVVDDNSKNHTYIDDKMIPAGTQMPITHGQILRLSDEEFEFKLY